MMRPRGPLPPRVYWTRRLLLVAAVMVVAALVWWVAPGLGGPRDASADPGSAPPSNGAGGPSRSSSGTGSTTSSQPPSTPATTTRPLPRNTVPTHTGPTKSGPTKGGPSAPGDGAARHRPLPTGPCDPSALVLAVVVENAVEGEGTTVGLRMSTPDGSTCSLGVTPRLLETRITSGDVLVWQSRSCPDGLAAKNVVVRPRPLLVYSFDWDGRVTPDSCTSSDQVAAPGGYWAEAALIGGEPQKTYFEVAADKHR